MCQKLAFPICVVLVLGCVGSVHADLLGHWKMDEGSGRTVVDSSGNGNDGTFESDPTWVTGIDGAALEFHGLGAANGGGDRVNCGNDASLDILGPISLALWIRPDADDPEGTGMATAPLSKALSSLSPSWSWQVRYGWGNAPQPYMAFTFNTSPRAWAFVGRNLERGEWVHIAGSHDGATLKCYVNGEETDSTPMGAITSSPTPLHIGSDGWGSDWIGLIDDVRIYDHGLSPEEVVAVMLITPPELSSDPNPEADAIDVSVDTVLSWASGDFAQTHDVYFGQAWEDVNNATAVASLGVVTSLGQADNDFDPGRLAYDAPYHWRVDEVNGAPDSTVFKGETWSFMTESFSIPIANITATGGSFGASLPEKSIDGSGLTDDLHGTSAPDMWFSASLPATIEYAFDRAYKLDQLWIWNSNQSIEPFVGFGAKDIVIEHSSDGENWTTLEGVAPLAQAPGAEGYAHNNTIDFDGVTAQHVRITVNSVHGIAPQGSLSEVRFFHIPTRATRPDPGSGASDVSPDVVLSWGRNGREADHHDVYVGTDPDNLPSVGSVTESSFDTLALDLRLGETYSWRVDEVNESMDPTTWEGTVWSFTTVDTIAIDDMESYRDEEFLEIWATWVDGFDDPANGSLVGNGAAGSPETGIVHGGSQSMPLSYGNNAATVSEATRTFAAPMDWTGHGVQGLVLYFQGSPDNTGGVLYLKINDTKVVYPDDSANLSRLGWNKWYVSLDEVTGTDLSSVGSLTIGVEGAAGVLYVDDIQLTPMTRELITPIEPADGLVVYYPFDGDFQDASGNGLHGTGMGGALGGPIFEPGQSGQAVLLDGAGQYVEITGYQGISAVDGVQQPFSVSNWFKTTGNGEMVTWGSTPGGQRLSWRVEAGNLRTEHGNGNLRGNTLVNDGEWHHAALVVQEGANLRVPNTTLYIDGLADGVNSGDDDPYILTPSVDVSIGRRATSADRYFPGSIDEVRIYDRALSDGEVAWLGGRTGAFDKP